MIKIPYSEAAQRAIQHEKAEEFIQAATFWRIAESFAVKPVNQDWAATRAELCEKRHTLSERRALLQVGASERAKEAAKTKARKKMAEALQTHMNNSTSGENQ